MGPTGSFLLAEVKVPEPGVTVGNQRSLRHFDRVMAIDETPTVDRAVTSSGRDRLCGPSFCSPAKCDSDLLF